MGIPPVMEEALSLTIPDRLDALDALRRALRCWLDRAGVERETAEDVVLATWEVCANAVEHPLDRKGEGVTLVASVTPRWVRVVVHDTGSWHGRNVERRGRGLGLWLARALMDRISIRRDLPGTKVVMWRFLGGPA